MDGDIAKVSVFHEKDSRIAIEVTNYGKKNCWSIEAGRQAALLKPRYASKLPVKDGSGVCF